MPIPVLFGGIREAFRSTLEAPAVTLEIVQSSPELVGSCSFLFGSSDLAREDI